MKVTTELKGVPETLAMFRGVELGLADFRQLGAWKAVRLVFYKIVSSIFQAEGGASGKWTALTAAYAKVKLRRWGNQPILTASGTLYRSLTQEGAEGSTFTESAQEMEVGTTIKYGAYHQTGTNKMPARPILDFTDEQEGQLMKPIQDKLVQLIGNAKLKGLRQGF